MGNANYKRLHNDTDDNILKLLHDHLQQMKTFDNYACQEDYYAYVLLSLGVYGIELSNKIIRESVDASESKDKIMELVTDKINNPMNMLSTIGWVGINLMKQYVLDDKLSDLTDHYALIKLLSIYNEVEPHELYTRIGLFGFRTLNWFAVNRPDLIKLYDTNKFDIILEKTKKALELYNSDNNENIKEFGKLVSNLEIQQMEFEKQLRLRIFDRPYNRTNEHIYENIDNYNNSSNILQNEPLNESPVEPLNESPVEPLNESPAEPLNESPVEPLNESPVEPLNESPIEPLNESPIEPLNESPVEPLNESPVEPLNESPVEPLNEQENLDDLMTELNYEIDFFQNEWFNIYTIAIKKIREQEKAKNDMNIIRTKLKTINSQRITKIGQIISKRKSLPRQISYEIKKEVLNHKNQCVNELNQLKKVLVDLCGTI